MVDGCAPTQVVKYCDVRVQRLDWVKYLSQYNIEEISDIWENVRIACLHMREVQVEPDFASKHVVKKDTSEDSVFKMEKTDPKTSVVFPSFEAALDNGLIKAAIRDTLVELAALKSPSKHSLKVHSPSPVTTGSSDNSSDPRSLFLSNFGLKPVVGINEGFDMKPRRVSKRLRSRQSATSTSSLVCELSSLLAESGSGGQPSRRPSRNSSALLTHKNKVEQAELIKDKVETINGNFETKDCSVRVRRTRIYRSTELVEEDNGGIDMLVEEDPELSGKEQEHQINKTTEQALVCEQGEGGSPVEKSKNIELDAISDDNNSSANDASDAVMDFTEPRLGEEGDGLLGLDKHVSREYVEPGLDDLKNCLDLSEKVTHHVTDYGSFRVTRSRSESRISAPVAVSAESAESFRDYKKRMQIKLKANLTRAPLSDGEDMDIDSDFDDEHPIWQPSKDDEKDTISSDEEDLTVTRINLDGIKENYKCNNCSKVYQKSGHLLKHMRSCSGTEIKLEYTEQNSDRQCNQCGVIFATAGSCRRHLVNIHTENLSPQKKVSKRSQEDESKKEIEKHQKERLECLKCKRKFVKSGHLVNHMKSVHQSVEEFVTPRLQGPDIETNNQCDFCLQSFATPASLRRHQIVHDRVLVKKEHLSPTKLNQPHACKVCDKRYVTKPSLKRHILTEHRGFKSTCELCGLAVARLDNHMVLAHGDQLVKCKICDTQLAPSSMSRHIRTVHMGCLVRCVECDMFVSNIHKHMAHAHAEENKEDSHTDHLGCDCVFFLGPSRFFPLKEEEE